MGRGQLLISKNTLVLSLFKEMPAWSIGNTLFIANVNVELVLALAYNVRLVYQVHVSLLNVAISLTTVLSHIYDHQTIAQATSDPAIQVRNMDVAPGSWLQHGSALAVAGN